MRVVIFRRGPFAQPLFAVALFISTWFYINEYMNGYVASVTGDSAVNQTRKSFLADDADDICAPFLDKPFPFVWKSFFPAIVNASVQGLPFSNHPNFTAWVQETARFFTYPLLLRSLQHAPQHLQMQAVLDKLRDKNGDSILQVIVLGGSSTAGHGCLHNPIQRLKIHNTPNHQCAWAGRWQLALDQVFPRGGIHVINMAMGGATSDVSSTILEYGIWPQGHPGPDILLWDHGVNEAILYDPDVISEHIRDFHEATRSVQFC